MSLPGRNDPCHCGSGKKYKKCHQEQDEARSREERSLATLSEWVAYYTRELCEAVLPAAAGRADLAEAAGRFFDGAPPAEPLDEPTFRQHALFDLEVDGAPLVAGAPADDGTDRGRLRTALAASHPTLLEVVEVKREKGVRVRDRLTGAESFVWDTEVAQTLDPLEIVVGRRIRLGDRPALLPGWTRVPFRGRKRAVASLEAELAAAGATEADARVKWLKANADRVYAAVRAAALPAPPREHAAPTPPPAEPEPAPAAPSE